MKAFNFEVYTCNPITGEEGWEIKFPTVFAENKQNARIVLKDHYPNFDCVILLNHEIEIKNSTLEAKYYGMGVHYFEPNNLKNYNGSYLGYMANKAFNFHSI